MVLSATELKWFSDVVLRLHGQQDERALFGELTGLLHQRFRSNITVVEEVAYSMATFRCHAGIVPAPIPAEYIAALDDSPMVLQWQARRPDATLHLCGTVSRAAFRRTRFFAFFGREFGLEDQLIGTFRTGRDVALNFSVSREVPFSDQDRIVVEHVRRHVRACLLRLRGSRAPVGDYPSLEIDIDAHGRTRDLPPDLRRVLIGFFPNARERIAVGRLPEEIVRWAAASRASLREALPQPLCCLRVEGPRGQLIMRYFSSGTGAARLRFTEEVRVPSVLALRDRGLTHRQCEVLHWLMVGKRDGEIGAILGCSGRTAGKHVEAILRKTRTDNRIAAAHVARQWLARDAG